MKNVTIHRSSRTHYLDLLPIFRNFSSVFSLSCSFFHSWRFVQFIFFCNLFQTCGNCQKKNNNDSNYFYKIQRINSSWMCWDLLYAYFVVLKLKSRWFYSFGIQPMIQRCKKESKSNKLNRICFGDVVQPPRKWMCIRK